MGSLFVKNLSGSFNSQHIGHEVINLFKADNNKVYFYIPPYGCIGSKQKTFFEMEAYQSIDRIFVFEDTSITNIFKFKFVINNPIKFDSFQSMIDEAKTVYYGGKPLTNIDFGDQGYSEIKDTFGVSDLEDDGMYVYPISYRIDEEQVFNFEEDNYFIYTKSSAKRNNLENQSKATFGTIYADAHLDDVNITYGQKQYIYKDTSALDEWYKSNIETLCTNERRQQFSRITVNDRLPNGYDDDNFLSFVRKTNDENYYTNYLFAILKSNDDLLKEFFKFLLIKTQKANASYIPSNVKCFIQFQSMTPAMKIINELLRFREEGESKENTKNKYKKDIDKLKNKYHYDDAKIEGYLDLSQEQIRVAKFIDGQIDLYLCDDEHRIVIENKILSGLNGKHEEISDDINQLVTYQKFLEHLNLYEDKTKNNIVLILCPFCTESNFANYRIDNTIVPHITYRDITDFFEDHINLVNEKYQKDFINTIKRQALTKQQLITYRFIKAING